MKKIVLTGGGTAGHVTPNIALIESLKKNNYEIYYIGRKDEGKGEIIEEKLIKEQKIPYYGISSGKLRRYPSKENLKDGFKVIKGLSDAKKILDTIKPDIIFSKGGYVTVPVIYAAKLKNIPVIIHESDYTPGLANKLSIPIAKKVFVSFQDTLESLPKDKGVFTGTPIRQELLEGSRTNGLKLTNFSGNKPIILMVGGSTGAVKLNSILRQNLSTLTENFDIIHICGNGNIDNEISNPSYFQIEYVTRNMKDILATSDIIISRAGSNSIFEFLALGKPALLIPLSKNASRGDQIQNSKIFQKEGFSLVLFEEDLTSETFISKVNELYNNKDKLIQNIRSSNYNCDIDFMISEIDSCIK